MLQLSWYGQSTMARANYTGTYPGDWPAIARNVKQAAGWKCERCGVPHGPAPAMLTVHHLDNDKSNTEAWNLAALCQRCHLQIQHRVDMFQEYMFEHTPWMQPHVEGRNRAIESGQWPREFRT